MIIETLEWFIKIKHEPQDVLLKKLGQVKAMDDRLYVLLHKNFNRFGVLLKKERQFEKPKLGLGGKERGVVTPEFKRKSPTTRLGK